MHVIQRNVKSRARKMAKFNEIDKLSKLRHSQVIFIIVTSQRWLREV